VPHRRGNPAPGGRVQQVL
ncbi:hypothetical protein BN1708_020650, partial [Verticillium longisporum]